MPVFALNFFIELLASKNVFGCPFNDVAIQNLTQHTHPIIMEYDQAATIVKKSGQQIYVPAWIGHLEGLVGHDW